MEFNLISFLKVHWFKIAVLFLLLCILGLFSEIFNKIDNIEDEIYGSGFRIGPRFRLRWRKSSLRDMVEDIQSTVDDVQSMVEDVQSRVDDIEGRLPY